MKKTINVNISGVRFTIDEDACQMLNDYLEALNKAFSKNDDASELMEDIEMRIAELMCGRQGGAEAIITLNDVETVIARMGKPDELVEGIEEVDADGEKVEEVRVESMTPPLPPKVKKRLFRSATNRYIGGVCAGLATYFGMDPTLLRLITVALCFLSFGNVVLVYLILWVVLPEATTPLDRLEMEGRPITMENIGDSIRNQFDKIRPVNESGGLGNAIARFCAILMKIVLVICALLAMPVLLFGLFILIICISALIASFFGGGFGSGTLTDIPMFENIARWGIVCAISWVVVVGIPLLFFVINVFSKNRSLLYINQRWKNTVIILWVIGAIMAGISTRVVYKRMKHLDKEKIERILQNKEEVSADAEKIDVIVKDSTESEHQDTVMMITQPSPSKKKSVD